MNETTNSLNWFEIPVTDMERAKHFYQVAFGIHMAEEDMMKMTMAISHFTGEWACFRGSGEKRFP